MEPRLPGPTPLTHDVGEVEERYGIVAVDGKAAPVAALRPREIPAILGPFGGIEQLLAGRVAVLGERQPHLTVELGQPAAELGRQPLRRGADQAGLGEAPRQGIAIVVQRQAAGDDLGQARALGEEPGRRAGGDDVSEAAALLGRLDHVEQGQQLDAGRIETGLGDEGRERQRGLPRRAGRAQAGQGEEPVLAEAAGTGGGCALERALQAPAVEQAASKMADDDEVGAPIDGAPDASAPTLHLAPRRPLRHGAEAAQEDHRVVPENAHVGGHGRRRPRHVGHAGQAC